MTPFYRLGLIGYPLGHSFSPQIHHAALRALGLEGEYRLYPTAPNAAGHAEIGRLLDRMRQDSLQGINVTIPHKQTVIRWLDDLTPAARQIGAVNTIFRSENRLVGDNTDAAGFLDDLKQAAAPITLNPQNALVLGAGGSARAVAYGLLTSAWRVTLAARRLEQIEAIRHQYHQYIGVGKQGSSLNVDEQDILTGIQLDCLAEFLDEAAPVSLIVNTTPLGMSPHLAASAWPTGLSFPPGAFVYDLVYNPPETILLQTARAAGLQAANGLGMLIAQAALAFERWTGLKPPLALLSPDSRTLTEKL